MSDDASTKIEVDVHRDLLLTTILHASEHVSEILSEMEYAPRQRLRQQLNELLELAINLNCNNIAASSAEEQYGAYLVAISGLAKGKFDIDRYME